MKKGRQMLAVKRMIDRLSGETSAGGDAQR
jgi:hypothetical protein